MYMHGSLNLCFLGPWVYRRLKLSNVMVYQRRVMFTPQDNRQHGRRRHVLDLPNFVPYGRQRVGLNRRSKASPSDSDGPSSKRDDMHVR